MNKLLKRILTVGASLALAAVAAVPALADTTPATPATKAEIDVTKIVHTLRANKFPTATDGYTFKLEPFAVVMGRDNGTQYYGAGVAGHENNMPMPSDGTAGTAKTITINGFLTNDGTTTDRTHKTAFEPITFDNTGIYTYKLTEVVPTTGKEAGITYDDSNYFVNVYVTNVMTNGTPSLPAVDETTGKLLVTISHITLFKGDTNGTMALQGKDFNDVLAEENATDIKLTDIDIPKEGHPDTYAMPVTFTNTYPNEELTISKTVTGNLGDPNKKFEFTFTPGETAPDTYSYAYQVYTMKGATPNPYGEGTTDTVETSSGSSGTFTQDSNPKIQLTHKQYVVITGLPVGLKYTVAETADPTYTTKIDWQNGSDATESAGTHGTVTATSVEGTIASTVKETTDPANYDNHAYFTNDKTNTPPTGVLLRFAPFALLAILLVVGIAFVVINSNKRRKNGYQGL